MINFRIFLFLLSLLLVASCSSEDDTAISSNNINDFVWKGLNSWYLWQEEAPHLQDGFNNEKEYVSLIRSYPNPQNFFYSMLYDYPNLDRFSFIVEDYEVLNEQFQGTSNSVGFRFALALQPNSNSEIFGVVRYVIPGSLAEQNGIERGDIFVKANGQTLNTSNYIDLLFGNSSYSIELANVENGNLVANGVLKNVQSEIITENPVFLSKVFDVGTKKIGYLMYNSFTFTFNDALNEAFTYFKNEGVNELILDLRYNGGGSLRTASYLASMINGSLQNQVFTEIRYNAKQSDSNRNFLFSSTYESFSQNGNSNGMNPISSLNISQLVVITSSSTASASEATINGLIPFINVQLVGGSTRGKDVGSITLFDSPNSDYTSKSNANHEHRWAMQPIVFRGYNSSEQAVDINGFTPDYNVNELDYLGDWKPLGDPTEIMLQTALNVLGEGRPAAPKTLNVQMNIIAEDNYFPMVYNMYP